MRQGKRLFFEKNSQQMRPRQNVRQCSAIKAGQAVPFLKKKDLFESVPQAFKTPGSTVREVFAPTRPAWLFSKSGGWLRPADRDTLICRGLNTFSTSGVGRGFPQIPSAFLGRAF
jgi:hypothetical protein